MLPAHAPAPARLAALDMLRGAALCAMIVYHAAWDAVQFGLIAWTPERDAVLVISARYIAGGFLLISGVSLALAAERTGGPLLRSTAFLRRLGALVAAAMLVSLATFVALPQAPIYFGILHHIALASIVLALLSRAHPFVALTLAAAVLLVNDQVAVPALNHPATIWLGLGTRAPVTADWVPIFPWLAAGLAGFALGRAWLVPWLASRAPQAGPPRSAPARALAWMGRHSLAIYLIHQPILIGAILLYQTVSGAR